MIFLAICRSHSNDEVDELFAVSNSLSSEDVKEDGDDDVRNNVGGVFDDGVKDEEDDTDVLGAVRGKKEANTGGFNGISEHGLNLVNSSTALIDILGFLDKSHKLSLGKQVVAVLLQDLDLLLDFRLDGLKSADGALILIEDGLHVGEGVDCEGACNKCDENKCFGHCFQIKYNSSNPFPD